MRALRMLCRLIAVASLLPAAAFSQTTLQTFSPSGTVKGVRQVQAAFSGQMVAFGDLRLESPFDVDCPEKGTGRWVDGSTWAYDFERDLPAGVSCRFVLKPALKDLEGKPVEGERSYSFNTGGPAVINALPREGSTIDEQQVFLLGLDAIPRAGSVAAHAWCRADGVNEKIPVREIIGAEREQILAARKDFLQRHLNVYYKARGVIWKASVGIKDRKNDGMPLAVLQCGRALPANKNVALVWGAGIESSSGLANKEDQTLSYQSRPDFTAKFSCQRLQAKGGCTPFLPMALDFSAPVPAADARKIVLVGPNGKRWSATIGKEEEKNEHVNMVILQGALPQQAKFRLELPPGIRDDAGRTLVNQSSFPLTVTTSEQPPLAKFPARFGIIEARGDRALPVTVRNVEPSIAGSRLPVQGRMARVGEDRDGEVIGWMRRLSGTYGWKPNEMWGKALERSILDGERGVERFSLPKPGGRRAFEVIGIPLRKPGFYVVELASPRLGKALTEKGGTAYVSAAALVTNLAAHFKYGGSSSLVWVTSLDKGRPVANAQVAVRGCTGALLWSGKTDASGVAHIREELAEGRCERSDGYFVSARKDGDFTFTLSNWDDGIEPWRFNLPSIWEPNQGRITSTVFDRTLLRAGETVHMKHFLRKHTVKGIELTRADEPGSMFITHEGSEQRYELPLKWNANGTAANEWKVPADAKQGWYELMIAGQSSGRFRVEQFRVPTMKATMQGPAAPAIRAEQVSLDLQLMYLSGGGAAGADVKLNTMVESKVVSFSGYEDFSFAAGDVKPGRERESAQFNDEEGEFEPVEEQGEGASGPVSTRKLVLDRAGGARVVVDKLPLNPLPAELLAEMTYQDANGETMSSTTRVPLWPSERVVGIQPDGWVMSRKKMKFTIAVLDVHGKPAADAPVTADFFQREYSTHRRRLVGGFYSYESSSEIKALGRACEGRTDAKGLLICETSAPAGGNLIVRAETQDSAQHPSVTRREIWVADGDDWWFRATDNDRIDLLPEQKRYEPGQEASFQVRMPFRQATALITVEREGILDTYVRELSGSAPVVSIPMKKEYAPNVYVSAMVVRGRVAAAAPTALVDLGKPAYKLGIASLRVGWAGHELKVEVKTDREVYKVREKAAVRVRVTRSDGSAPPAGSEVALAAVDVGLLELMPNTSWNLLEAMMQQRGLLVRTATAQMQVVGKRHYGRKAVPAGGGGGKGAGRELFDTLLFWKGRVQLDANGEASVQVPLNDSLTSFRIVAIASANADLFGTGRADIRSTQDLMLLSGLPALVREDDSYRAGVTVRNTTASAIAVQLAASMGGKALAPQAVELGAGEAREIGWDVTVPAGAGELAWEISASAGGAVVDRLRGRQKVVAAVPVRTLQATLMQVDKPLSMTVQAPADALPGRGGIRTLFTARLASELPGVREFMLQYPYSCLEQQASRAIALRSPGMWEGLAGALPSYLDSDGLAKYFPSMQEGSDSLTAYLLSASDEAGYAIPEQQKQRMEDALEAFVTGRIVRGSPLATADLAVRKIAALEALSRSSRVKQEMLQSFEWQPNLWPTSAVIDWYLVWQRSPELAGREQGLREAEQILRSRLNLQGTAMTFSTERRDDWWWLMASADVNANRLLLAMLDNPAWQRDMGRLARGTMGRQQKGRWGTTVANAWGVLAMEKFSDKFESQPVAGEAVASLGQASKRVSLSDAAPAASAMLPWPRGSGNLGVQHHGSGKPWVTVQSLAAVPLAKPLSSGYTIRKTVTPLEQRKPGVWSRGDVYRVHLDLEAQSDMTWVVVDDPIPASASVLGTGLGNDSRLLVKDERAAGWVWPAFQERSFEAFRSYYAFVPKGKWSVEYTVRLNNAGRFLLPPTRVEAMYSPEMFGELPNAPVSVR
jgi:hypothetical protein